MSVEARTQALPLDRAILWNPVSQGARLSGRAPYPIFFQQEAVVALQEHVKASPQQAIFGFLAGDLLRDPETGVLYAVIDKTLRLNQAIYGDKTEVVVARLWERMQEQLARASGRLLGWYHSHPGHELSLSSHDVETHAKYFTEPWHVAVLVDTEAGGAGVVGGFFRTAPTAAWVSTPLPFYELLQPDSIRADGKKRSFMTWKNYKAFNPVAAKRHTPPPSAALKAPAEPVFVPTPAPTAPHRPVAAPPPPPPPPPPRAPAPPPPPPPKGAATPSRATPPPARRPPAKGVGRRTPAPSFRLLDEPPRAKRSRRGLWLTLLAVLLIGGGGAAAGYWYFFMRQPGTTFASLFGRPAAVVPPAPAPAPPDTALARFDGLSDTVSQAVRNYQERATLFANRQIDCSGLARGLVAVDSLWIVYSRQRRTVQRSLDSARTARDQALSAGVDMVASQFDRSRCPRP